MYPAWIYSTTWLLLEIGMDGEGAKKLLPQRRLNFIDGMISSHFSLLNSADKLDLTRQANEVSAVLADLEVDRQEKKEQQRKKKEEE